jgi:hypothetical protein
VREGSELDVQEYRKFYLERLGHLPSMKMIESFLRMYPQKEPDPTLEEFWQEEEIKLPKFKLVREEIK